MTLLPKARTDNLVVQNAGQDLLIYDFKINKAFCLNTTSATVYEACDGITTVDELQRRTGFTDELIYLALDELKRSNLLTAPYELKFKGRQSRRAIIKHIGLTSLAALPIIAGLVAPTAAQVQSLCNDGGFENSQGTCPNGLRCVDSVCRPCIPDGQPLGGCGITISNKCCSLSGCMLTMDGVYVCGS